MSKPEKYLKERLLEKDGTTIDIDTEGIVEIKKDGAEVIKLTKNDLEFVKKVMD